MSTRGLFDNEDTQAPVAGFLSEVFLANPNRVQAWVEPYLGIPGRHVLYWALWACDSPNCLAVLKGVADVASPDEATQIHAALASPAPSVNTTPIESPMDLDYLWGRFMAAGSADSLNRIIDQIKLVNREGDDDAMLIGQLAVWSVSANARQHRRVFELVKAKAATADPQTSEILNKIIAEIVSEGRPN